MRLFLDANILFSAAKSDGAIRELVRRLREAGHECVADSFVVEEARRNLASKGPQALTEFESMLAGTTVAPMVAARGFPSETAWLPEKDRPVLAAAIRLGCDGLLTGDRTHFGSGYGKTFGGVRTFSPRDLAMTL